MYAIILCRKYEEDRQIWMQHRSQKCKCHSLITGDSFPNFEEWIANIINDEKEGKDIKTKESELSQSPHIWAT